MFIFSPTRALEHYMRERVTRRRMLFHYGVLMLPVLLTFVILLYQKGEAFHFVHYIDVFLLSLYVCIPYVINRTRGGGIDFLPRFAVTNTQVFLFVAASLVAFLPIAIFMLVIEMPYGLEPDWVLWSFDTMISSVAVMLAVKAFWVATRTTPR